MPTALPRLPVTLTAEQRDLLERIAAANGTSKSKVLAELLDAAAPVLLRVAAALENVQKLDAEKREAIRATIDEAQADAEHTAATAMALLERIGAPRTLPEVAAKRAPPAKTVDLAAARKKHLAPRRRRLTPPSC